MFNLMLFSIFILSFLFILMSILYMISMKTFMDREKCSPFECGFDPFESPRVPFSSHFFLVAVIFLIFDVELVVIMPIVVIMYVSSMIDVVVIVTMIIMILIVGLYHEWNNNMLDWTWGYI